MQAKGLDHFRRALLPDTDRLYGLDADVLALFVAQLPAVQLLAFERGLFAHAQRYAQIRPNVAYPMYLTVY